jgi:hypothetical protein
MAQCSQWKNGHAGILVVDLKENTGLESTDKTVYKKNANDDFRILSIQSFDNGKKIKESIGIRILIDDFNSDFNSFNPKKI